MKIPLILNGKKTILSADPVESLLSLLRREKLFSVKCGCMKGVCGNCTVLLDDQPVASCRIPVAIVRECEVVTLEYFKNESVYRDIISGFSKAGVNLCGWCNSGKIFSAYSILKNTSRPSVQEILDEIKDLDPCCTDSSTLVNGILYAVSAKYEREGKTANAKK